MPKKRATDPNAKKRDLPARAAHDKKRVDGLFNPASTAPKPPKETKKKKKEAPKKKKKVTRKTKPSYLVMIKRAIVQQNHHNGSSLFAIYKFLEDNYPVSESFHRFVRAALKKGVADGMLSRFNLSYRLTAKGRATIGKSKKKASSSKKAAPSAGTKRKRSASKEKKKDKKKKSSSSKKKKASTKKSKGKEKEKEKGHEEKSHEKEAPKKKRAAPTKRGETTTTTTSTISSASSSTTTPKRVSAAGYKFRWQYQDGAWKDYEMNASDLVEAAYQGYIKNPGMCDVRAVKSGQWQYQVDFLNLKQTNIQHENHTTRAIRRVPLDE